MVEENILKEILEKEKLQNYHGINKILSYNFCEEVK